MLYWAVKTMTRLLGVRLPCHGRRRPATHGFLVRRAKTRCPGQSRARHERGSARGALAGRMSLIMRAGIRLNGTMDRPITNVFPATAKLGSRPRTPYCKSTCRDGGAECCSGGIRHASDYPTGSPTVLPAGLNVQRACLHAAPRLFVARSHFGQGRAHVAAGDRHQAAVRLTQVRDHEDGAAKRNGA